MKYCIALFLLGLVVVGCRSGNNRDKKVIVNVSVQKAVAKNVPLLVSAPATVFGKSEAHISARITASIQQVLVHKGQAVKTGQGLAVLDRRDLAAQHADAVASMHSAEASLERTEHASIPLQLTQARGDLAAKKAALNLASKVYERRKQLLAEGAISGRDLQISEAELAQAQANFDAAQTNFDAVEKHTSVEDLRTAKNNLAQSQARESLAAANLSFAEIRSPFSGTVTEQLVFPGDMASTGTQLFTVADMSTAVARAQVDADQVTAIKIGQSCSFSKNDGSEPAAQGKITVVNQAVDTARRTVEVWCEIPNHDGTLKSGFFGSVKIVVGKAPQAVAIPSSAIEFEEGTQKGKVYAVDDRQIAHLRTVTAVSIDDQEVRVSSGLRAGELVITAGEYGLPDGTQVNPAGANQ
jgi:multidrug efflux pump subunit AcrA (membrane-fusion protein)